jgi:Cu(I)/Ag(I) efflux system membrane fusion protein
VVLAGRIVLVRLRFVLLLAGLLLLVGYWDVLRNHWDKLTRGSAQRENAVSWDTEYWCPMCPGVLSDWPGKCPVCNMTLVRRKKGEAVPLPDGVVVRMQLSPYRVQLAGIQTTPVEYRPLVQEFTATGFVQSAEAGRVRVVAEVSEPGLTEVEPGLPLEVVSEALPGVPYRGQVLAAEPRSPGVNHSLRLRLEVEDLRHELRPGMLVTARARLLVARRDWFLRVWNEGWKERTTADLVAHALVTLTGPATDSGLQSLLWTAVQYVPLRQGMVLAVPESAVVDTGAKRVVYVEHGPGMYDGVEVVLGRRVGDHYPVLRGLEAGQQVVSTGAFLLDAEGRLNPSIAANYFGAKRSSDGSAAPESTPEPISPATDAALIARQKVCPVSDEPLGSMGPPVRVVVEGKTVFVCCQGCIAELRRDPKTYLAKLRSN